MKKILIDGRFVGVGESISRYVLETLQGVLKLDRENQYTLLIRPQGEKSLERYPDIVNASNLKVDILEIPHYSFAEQIKLLQYLNKEKFDLVHFTQFNHPVLYKKNYVVTIHDLTLVGHLHYHNWIKQLAYNMVMKSAAKDSKKIIAISKTTKDDVIDFFGTPDEKFEIIYHGIDHRNFNSEVKNQRDKIEVFKKENNIVGDYILYTGAWKKHKNLARLLEAFEQFIGKSKLPLQLVLLGKIDRKEPEIIALADKVNKSLNRSNAIITTGFVDENILPFAYGGALFYVIPSLSEGFGWPPLEAMACGTPVISSNLSCMPEILGEAALYFDPYDVNEMIKSMEKVSSDNKIREDLIAKGLVQAKKFDWDLTSKRTLGVYKAVL